MVGERGLAFAKRSGTKRSGKKRSGTKRSGKSAKGAKASSHSPATHMLAADAGSTANAQSQGLSVISMRQ